MTSSTPETELNSFKHVRHTKPPFQRGKEAYENNDHRAPMQHGIDPESQEGKQFTRGYNYASKQAMYQTA